MLLEQITQANEWCELVRWLTQFFFCSFRHWFALLLFTMVLFGHFGVEINRDKKDKENEE